MRSVISSYTFAVILVAAALTSCTSSSDSPLHLAEAGEVFVDAEEVTFFLKSSGVSAPDELDEDSLRRHIKSLLARKALAAEAEKEGLDRKPAARKALAQWKLSNYPTFFWKTQVEDVEVTDEDLWKYLEPVDQYLLDAMVFPADEEGLLLAREVLALLRSGGDFTSLAKERSYGLLRESGGDMGWQVIPNRSIPEADAKVIRGMKPGEVSEPLETLIGWVIYRLRDAKTAEETLAAEKERALPSVKARLAAEERHRTLKEILESADIVYPEEKPGGPIVIINGRQIFDRKAADEFDTKHKFGLGDLKSDKKSLGSYIEAYLLTLEVEKRGLDGQPPLSSMLRYERMRILSQSYIRKQVVDQLSVSEEEIEAHYTDFYRPELFRLQTIQTLERQAAEEAYSELEAGADFGDVAEEYNPGRIKASRGIVDAVYLSSFPEEVEREVDIIPDGEYTGVLQNVQGFIIVKRLASTEVAIPPLDSVRSRVKGRLLLKKRSDLVKAFVNDFAGRLDIRINEQMLKEL
jgi:peptidyl-prolyl cis-trans isomerase C